LCECRPLRYRGGGDGFLEHHSDRKMERNWHAAIPAACAGIALISCAVLTEPVAIMAALTFGITGVFCYVAVFWAVPSAMLTGTGCRRRIGLINAVAMWEVLSAPRWWMDQGPDRQFLLGIVAIGCGPLIAAVVAVLLRSARKFEQPAVFDASGSRS